MKNLIIRALTGIIFVVVLISAIYIHPIFFLILFCIITGLTLWEFGGLVKHYENANLQRTVNVLGISVYRHLRLCKRVDRRKDIPSLSTIYHVDNDS